MKRRSFLAYTAWLVTTLATFLAKAQNKKNVVKNPFTKFLKDYPPDGEVKPFIGALSSNLKTHAHPTLISFWKTVGFGSFGDGFLHLFHPDEYAETLAQWLMSDKIIPDKIPFARTAFGDLIYFRDLREKAKAFALPSSQEPEDICDISFLSVHYQQGDIISYKVEDFFNGELELYLKDSKLAMFSLYRKIRGKMPKPSAESCYFFEPALAFGGQRTVASFVALPLAPTKRQYR